MEIIKNLGYIQEKKQTMCIVKCAGCGKEYTTSIQNAIKSRGCRGCFSGGDRTKTKADMRFYGRWWKIKSRCINPNDKNYKDYGARGIDICAEWHDFSNFKAWASISGYEPHLTIERKDNNGDYEPNNCTWATRESQRYNQRMRSNNTSGYEGISWNYKWWDANITHQKKRILIGKFSNKLDAVKARDKYIIEHKLPHKLSSEHK